MVSTTVKESPAQTHQFTRQGMPVLDEDGRPIPTKDMYENAVAKFSKAKVSALVENLTIRVEGDVPLNVLRELLVNHWYGERPTTASDSATKIQMRNPSTLPSNTDKFSSLDMQSARGLSPEPSSLDDCSTTSGSASRPPTSSDSPNPTPVSPSSSHSYPSQSKLEQQISTMAFALEQKTLELDTAQRKAESASKLAELCQGVLKATNSTKETLSVELKVATEKLQVIPIMEKERDDMKERLSASDARISDLLGKVEFTNYALAQARSTLIQTRGSLKDTQEEIVLKDKRIEGLGQQAAQLTFQLDDTRTELLDARRECTSLRVALADAVKLAERKESHLRGLQTKLQSSKLDSAAIRDELAATARSLAASLKAEKALQEQIRKLTKDEESRQRERAKDDKERLEANLSLARALTQVAAETTIKELRHIEAWDADTRDEVRRCKLRDREFANARSWSDKRALKRFKMILEEFEDMEFSEECPLTMMAVPWPVFDHPLHFDTDDVESDDVEEFFGDVKHILGSEKRQEYKRLVNRTRNAFSAERWKSLLETVRDSNTRADIAIAAGRVVKGLDRVRLGLRK